MKKYFTALLGAFLCNLLFVCAATASQTASKVANAAPIKIYGALVMGNQGKTPCGIYSFDVSDNLTVTEVHPDSRINSFCNGTYGNGKYYAYLANFEYGYLMTSLKYVVFDTEDWSLITEKELTPDVQNRPTHLIYNPVTEKLYAYIISQQTFFEVDFETGGFTQIGIIADKYFNMFAVDSFGKIYATDSTGDFFTVDLVNLSYKHLGNTNFGTTTTCAGVIDPESGRFFMAYCPPYGSVTKLIELDVNSGAGTELALFPQGECFSSLFIKGQNSIQSNKLPSVPSDLSVAYTVPGRNEATLHVVAPSVAFDKVTLLEDAMTINFYVDDKLVGEVAGVAPGAETTLQYTFTPGVHVVKAKAKTDAGEGPDVSIKTFAGFDAPTAAQDINLMIDEAGNYSLIWTAPEKGVNNGELNQDALRYRVVAYPGGKVLAEEQSATAMFGKIESKELKNYCFGVTVVCGEQQSEETLSNAVVFGEYAFIPYVEDFQTDEQWPLYTVVDYNEDNCTWAYDEVRKCASYLGGKNAGEDFLFTPAFKMSAYVTYTISFGGETAFNQKASLKVYAEKSNEIPWGGQAEMNRLKEVLMEDVYSSHTANFTPTESGYYHFAIECNNYADGKFFLRDFNVTASASSNAPEEVTDFTLTPGEKGALEVTVDFKAPTILMNGDEIAEGDLTAIYLYRGNDVKPIHVFDHPAKGETLTYLDTEVFQGANSYRVMTLNENGNSDGVGGEVWVGEDFSMNPQNFKVKIVDDNCVFTWEPPVERGFHDGYIDFDKLTYTLKFIIDDVLPDEVPLAFGITDLTYTIPVSEFERFASKDRQVSINFILSPITSMGEGVPAYDNCILGKPYDLPFAESFADNIPVTYPWGVVMVEGGSDWFMVGESPISDIAPYDNDGGMAMFYHKNEGVSEARLQSPCFLLEGAENPVLEFFMFHRNTFDDDNNYLQIEVVNEEGAYIEVGERILVGGEFGWKKHSLSLKDVPAKSVRLSFRARGSQGNDFYIDAIRVSDKKEVVCPAVDDLQGELSADQKSVVLTWSAPKGSEELSLIGYYIYCDGVKLADNYVTECTYIVQLTDSEEHTYAVMAVYNEGDSPLSNEVIIRPVGIDSDLAEGVRVYAAQGSICIDGAEGMAYQLFDLTGKQVAQGVAEGHTEMAVAEGLYMVRVNGTAHKCVVW